MNSVAKKIILRGIILAIPFIVYYLCWPAYRIYERDFENDGRCLYQALDKSYRTVNKKKVVFGESVALQLYPLDSDLTQPYYTLTTTRPASIIAVYVLLENFISRNRVDSLTFYYIIGPSSMDEHLQYKWTYNHLLKPFCKYKYRQYFTPDAFDSIRLIPYWYAAQIPFIKISDWQPKFNYVDGGKEVISPVAVEYLQKIQSLAKQHHFSFYTLCPLLSIKDKGKDYSELKSQIGRNDLEEMFSQYFGSMKYVPEQDLDRIGHYINPAKYGPNPLGI